VKILDAIKHRVRPDRMVAANAESRRALLNLLPIGSVGAEVGVWKGDFSAQILERVRPVKLHLIDPWSFQADLPKAWYGGASATSQLDMDAIHDGVCKRFARQIADGVIDVHRAPSEVAANGFSPGELDWVYLDGDHRYEAVRDELVRFGAFVKPGGYVVGDDYHSGGWWEGGVKRAVDEWAETTKLDDVQILGSQFVARLAAPSEA